MPILESADEVSSNAVRHSSVKQQKALFPSDKRFYALKCANLSLGSLCCASQDFQEASRNLLNTMVFLDSLLFLSLLFSCDHKAFLRKTTVRPFTSVEKVTENRDCICC